MVSDTLSNLPIVRKKKKQLLQNIMEIFNVEVKLCDYNFTHTFLKCSVNEKFT